MASMTMIAVALSLAVPAPGETKDAELPPPTGPAPIVLFVKAHDDGKVRIPIQPTAPLNRPIPIQIPADRVVPQAQPLILQVTVQQASMVELKDIEDLTVKTTTGAKVELADAAKRLAGGGFVLIPSDGKAISSSWLQLYRSDRVLVLSSASFSPLMGGNVSIGTSGTILMMPPTEKK
jgi:hypothetical protein